MNLNAPCFDSVLAIDAQLQRLQTEVAQMDKEFANYKPQAARKTKMQQNKASTPSPEIEEERKDTAKRAVRFEDESVKARDKLPTGRDILVQQAAKPSALCDSHLQSQHMYDLDHQYCAPNMGLTSQVTCSQQQNKLRYQNLPPVQQANAQSSIVGSKIRPQISKQYVTTL